MNLCFLSFHDHSPSLFVSTILLLSCRLALFLTLSLSALFSFTHILLTILSSPSLRAIVFRHLTHCQFDDWYSTRWTSLKLSEHT